MLFRSVLLLVCASHATLYVAAAHKHHGKPRKPYYTEPAPEPSTYLGPEPSIPWPEPTWKPEPTGWAPSSSVSKPTSWQSSSAWVSSEPTPSASAPPKPEHTPPNNDEPATPERYSRPFSNCFFGNNWSYYVRGFRSGRSFVNILLEGYEDCGESQSTIDILQQSAPYYPNPSNSSPSLYCRNLGYYKGFVWAVDKFEEKCVMECKDDGVTIGNQAAMLLCNLPTVRRLAVDQCSRSFKAGCALEFEKVVRDNCPMELNGLRYQQIKSTVCVF